MNLINALSGLSKGKKSFVIFLYDFAMICLAYVFSFYIRLETWIPESMTVNDYVKFFIISAIAQFTGLYLFGVYKGIWRFASTFDLLRIIKGVSFGVFVSIVAIFFVSRLQDYPRSVFVIDWMFLLTLLGGGRFSYRMIRDRLISKKSEKNAERVIIIGAGIAGERLLRDIRNAINLHMQVVGFVDDADNKQGKILNGVPIIGKIADLSEIIKKQKASQILIAIPSAKSQEVRSIIKHCSDAKVQFKMLPKFQTIIQGTSLESLQNISPEDFLGRDKVELESGLVKELIQDKIVLVTGAGGSIGSELVRQIANMKPAQIYLLDSGEYNLYEIERNLLKLHPQLSIKSIIADVRNAEKINSVISKVKPSLVLHAAAYKHVPLMEMDPYESIQTNVKGTFNVSEACGRMGVSHFVLVSTDKAVNPTNVMGATKRIAEMVCVTRQKKYSKTKYTIVRFGNVLGSSGSVVPLFKEQIEKGGPVTITHPDIERYFMSIPEAASLILEASTIGQGDEIFILDMGKPVKIIELAKHMITIAGMKINEDIKIEYTGLRPGEKLFEELFRGEEKPQSTHHPKVFVSQAISDLTDFERKLDELIKLGPTNAGDIFKESLRGIVSEYNFSNSKEQNTESVGIQ